jgi:cardiolipin synthase A/B
MAALLNHPWWLLTLAAIGVLAIVILAMNLFTALGDRPDSTEVTSECAVDSPEFLQGMAGVLDTAVQRGGTARLLQNGAEFFPALLAAIEEAEHTVTFMTYIWEDGEVSDRVFDALLAAQRRGVEVRLLIDGFGGLKAPDHRIRELRDAGGRWEWFHPPRFGKLTRFHKRNHRRCIVVDGRLGFTGGMSVMDKWQGRARNPSEWRDCMLEVHGRLAANLQTAFAQLWSHVTGEMLIGDHFYGGAQELEGGPGEPIFRHLSVVSSPSVAAHPMRFVHWLACRSARERIYITNPYFVPDEIMARVLMARARAGVDVRVLVPNEHNDVRVIRWASHYHYEKLLAAGLRIYEYQPTMIHHKHVVIDSQLSIAGSVNLDVRSKELNQENALVIVDRGFAAEMEATFLADLERAREIRLEEFRQRPWRHRLVERAASLFEEQF